MGLVSMLFWCWLTATFSCTCSWPEECQPLSDIPSRLQHDNASVPMFAVLCNASSSSFELSLRSVLGNLTTVDRMSFIDLDIYVKCSSPEIAFDFDGQPVPNEWVNITILTSIRTENCNLTWETLNTIGKTEQIYLRHVFFFMNEVTWNPVGNWTPSSDQSGIETLNEIQFRIQLSRIDSLDLSRLLPPDINFPHVANLAIHCFNTSKAVKYPRCENGVATYNATDLPNIFPELQGLFVQGFYSNSPNSQPFPWTVQMMFLPFNLSRTIAEQDDYTNGIVDSVEPYYFRRLLSINRVTYINMSDFCMLQGTITRIDLHNANVKDIPYHHCFSAVRGLVMLDMSYNDLRKLNPKLFEGLTDLQQLYLNNNKLIHISTRHFEHLINLKLLDLSNNCLGGKLEKGTFANLTFLKSISLENNSLEAVESGAFANYSTELNFINLRNNSITRLPRECIRFPRLVKCSLDSNQITLDDLDDIVKDFDPSALFMWDPLALHGEVFSYYSEGDEHDTDETELRLQDNNITKIPFHKIARKNPLHDMVMKRKLAALLTFAQVTLDKSAQLHCDCELLEFRHFLNVAAEILYKSRLLHTRSLTKDNFRTWTCIKNHILTGKNERVPFLKVHESDFLCATPACPDACSCYRNSKDTDYYIDCKGTEQKQIPLLYNITSKAKFVVSLEGNQIKDFVDCRTTGYKWLKQVTSLSLRNNHLSNTNSTDSSLYRFLQCLEQIQELDLSVNDIHYVPEAIRSMSFSSLRLSANNIQCCGATWLKGWLYERKQHILDYSVIYCGYPAQDLPIIEMNFADFDCSGPLRTVAYAVATAMAAAISVSFCWFHKRDLRIKIYTATRLRLFDTQQELMSCKYDTYLMYCDKDFHWSQMTLLTGLETLGFKLYDKNRDADFQDLGKQIEEALEDSHRVLVVLSDDLLTDQVALQQFERAIAHSKNRKKSRYIIIISFITQYDLVTTYMYDNEIGKVINWHAKHGCYASVYRDDFWQRLIYWLPDRAKPPNSTDNMIDQLQ